jgi:NAD(P)H-dependent FMN reductase
MHLTVLNGSPRGRAGNTAVILRTFLDGYSGVPGATYSVEYLYDPGSLQRFQPLLHESWCLLLAFPLYVDAMPSAVKELIESLEPMKGRLEHLRMAYIVHSGFPEPIHSRHVERYLVRLTERLGAEYVGTLVKGASEGLRKKVKQDKSLTVIRRAGKEFAKTGRFEKKYLKQLAPWEKMPAPVVFIFKILEELKILDRIWDKPLRENDAWDRRFDRPYK